MRIGILVNPIAGMGGTVGLKGTDGPDILREAQKRGAMRTSARKATEALRGLRTIDAGLEFVTCGGDMGKAELDSAGMPSRVLYKPADRTTKADTQAAVRSFLENSIGLLIFAGGDGTARDILEIVGGTVPIVGIPTGVKMHSAVFVNRLDELASLVTAYLESGATRDAEVMDIDEEEFRRGVLKARLFGIARVPDDPLHIQSGKAAYHSGSADEEAREIGQYVAENMEGNVLYVIGPGSTTAAIANELGCEKTVLGVDLYLNKALLVADASENDILSALRDRGDARIIVTPIGAQGFVFGRGNQQLSPRVIRSVGKDNLLVIATPTKLRNTPVLRVDTGDGDLDSELRGSVRVITGYKRRKLCRIQ